MSAEPNINDEAPDRKAAALALLDPDPCIYVLPVDPKLKRPDRLLAPNGFKDATRDRDVVEGWFDVKPRCNIGIACGWQYGLLVLDVDVKNGAHRLQTLNNLWIGMPTLTANTPSGGFHLHFHHPFFKHPSSIPLVAKLDGIDIKGAEDGGGYVLAPPSTLPNGAYNWRDAEIAIADLPDHLCDELRADKGASSPKKAATGSTAGPVASIKVPEGKRHTRLVELGAIYRGKGLQPDEIEALLWEHARRYFDPPFSQDNAEHQREIDAVVRWYGGKAAPEGEALALSVLTTPELIARADTVSDRVLLDPVLPEAGNLMIYGPSGGGKSHLALAVALALARGSSVLNWSAAHALSVLFCDGEMPLPELKARLQQYLAGTPAPDSLFWAAARAQETEMPDLADPAEQGHYLQAIEACKARVAVFDNLSCLRQTSAENPENSVEAWQPVAAFIRRLNTVGVSTVTVHHAAKNGSQRGSSAHTAVMDTVLRIAAPGEGQADPHAELDVEIHFEKNRRFGGEAKLPLRAKVVGDPDGFATWVLGGADPLVDDVVRLRKAGMSVREIAALLKRSKNGIQKAIARAKARAAAT